MILLVPIAPEVPKKHLPQLWPALVMVLLLCTAYLFSRETLQADVTHLEEMPEFVESGEDGKARLTAEGHAYLSQRPLLRIAPAKGDWSYAKLIYANFIHGSAAHLLLNLVGVFAGARLCTTFIPFLCTFSIFILAGSLGLFASIVFSKEISSFIPHVGASAGIFAMMGTYFVYNFKFRTRYFFWFPSRQRFIHLKTATFFFVDVILLELFLSAAQLLPERIDSVDHLAHVVGFASGAGLALLLRFVQKWPAFLQTRAEFAYWSTLNRKADAHLVLSAFSAWSELLKVNPYNDEVKIRLLRIVELHEPELDDGQLAEAFSFVSPTYVRLQTKSVADALVVLLGKSRRIPPAWLRTLPYDSVIRLARHLAVPVERQPLLLRLVSVYRQVHPEGGDVARKLELLGRKLDGLVPNAKSEAEKAKTDSWNDRTKGAA